MPSTIANPEHRVRVRNGVLEFPVHHMRGGTSTGLVIHADIAPCEETLREELVRHLMGVPLEGTRKGDKQTTGLGRGTATSNKVFFASMEDASGAPRIVSTLAQLAPEKSEIDWSVNCGNMSAALPFWALDMGFGEPGDDGSSFEIDIYNTNTGVTISARVRYKEDGLFIDAEIPGVDGGYPAVDLILHQPAGAKTGRLLPTGNAVDVVGAFHVSCVDVAVPMVIARAAEFGKTAHEPIAELDADATFKEAIRAVWVEAGLRMGLKTRSGTAMTAEQLAHSETIPKFCIIGTPEREGALSVRYFTPQTGHASLAVTGGCCLAAAALIPGSVAHELAVGLQPVAGELKEIEVGLENPAGLLLTSVTAQLDETGGLRIPRAAYKRSAQILLRGHVPLHRASPALKAAFAGAES